MITKKDVVKFNNATEIYKNLKEPVQKRVEHVARRVADLKVWDDEDVCCDPSDPYTEDQVFEDGLERDIVTFKIEGEELIVWHTDLNPCMAAVATLALFTKAAYLWNDKLFEKEILKPLKVFEDEAKLKRETRYLEEKARREERERKEYEKLKEKFGE